MKNNIKNIPSGCFYSASVKTIIDKNILTLHEFKERLTFFKPSEIFHEYYSDSRPCYYVSLYDDDNDRIYVYADNSDRSPKEYTYERLYNEFSFQDLTLFTFK